MEIIPNRGIGPIHFRMTPREVKAIMGEKLVYEAWMETPSDGLYYPGIVFCFDKWDRYGPLENGHISEIWINATFSATYKGILIFQLKQEAIEQLLQSEGVSYETREGGDSVGIYAKAYQLEFALEQTNLVQISLFAPR